MSAPRRGKSAKSQEFGSEIRGFLRSFTKELMEGNAAIFAGAGLSVASGYVNWAELMRDIADDLGLSVDREENLVAVAQFHLNERRNRTQLNRKIIEEFSAGHALNPNHEILARLPIATYWTTNYDKLIETALEKQSRIVDVKYTSNHLKHTLPGRQATVYKMHGDVSHPDDAVLTKDDYEGYFRKHEAFVTALSGDLVSKTFLFLGFSFSDPNIDYVLSRVRVTLRQAPKQHYCIIRREKKKPREKPADFEYRKRKQSYFIRDLDRFGIHALIVDDYSEITNILGALERLYRRRTVFISGSAHEFGTWRTDSAALFIEKLGEELVKRKLAVVTGYGVGVGPSIISGAYKAINSDRRTYSDYQLIARPFPIGAGPLAYTRYREDMIDRAGLAIYLFGNKRDNRGRLVMADGIVEEFEIAHRIGLTVIPVGATGFQAERLWNKVRNNWRTYFPHATAQLKKAFDHLGNKRMTGDTLIKKLLFIIDEMRRVH